MYLGIDVGGTKTLVATLDDKGVILEQQRFSTPEDYDQFKAILADTVALLSTKDFIACGVGFPGKIDRDHGVCVAMGNKPWRDVPVVADVQKIVACPVVVDNDAKLAGLSEAMLLKAQYSRVLYVTISTGIGVGLIVNQKIDPGVEDAEGGFMLLEHKGKLERWEDFASGSAIVRRFNKQAKDITDEQIWHIISQDIALGLIDLIAVMQPQIIVLGGGVGTHFDRFQKPLSTTLQSYATPLVPIPPIIKAARPEEAVIYGCYDLAKDVYGSTR